MGRIVEDRRWQKCREKILDKIASHQPKIGTIGTPALDKVAAPGSGLGSGVQSKRFHGRVRAEPFQQELQGFDRGR